MLRLEDIFTDEILQDSVENLLSKRNSCGYDGIMVKDFEEYWTINKNSIIEKLLLGQYEPSPVQNQEIVAYGGKRRVISKLTCTDRVILRAASQKLQEQYESTFSESSFAYRKNKGISAAVEHIVKLANTGYKWVLECDIEDFFDTIPLERLLNKLERTIEDSGIIQLIKKYLYCAVEADYKRTYHKKKGIVQGSPLSPLLSNVYLDEIDKKFEEDKVPFCRFADDIKIFFFTREDAASYISTVEEYVMGLGLRLNPRKTGIRPILSGKYYGFELFERGSSVYARRKTSGRITCYSYWHREAIQRIGQNYHLINDGILSKRDFTLLFENEDGKKYLPIETISSVSVYSNVIFSAEFFQYINRRGLSVALFNKYGKHVGSFVGSNNSSSAKTMLKQAAVYNDPAKRLGLAKKLMISALHNIRSNLKYYQKHSEALFLDEAVTAVSKAIEDINEAASINEILMIEGRARQKYYQTFNCIIANEDFYFVGRTKRPPKDALNALISFGNTFLYNRISTEINKTSLDIRIGILHSTNNRSESLNLDIAEIFKPIIIDRVIFSLINKKMIDAGDHFERSPDGKGVFLNKGGKRIFLNELEDKLYQKITVKERRVYYHTLIREEVNKLLRVFLHDEKYTPYKYY